MTLNRDTKTAIVSGTIGSTLGYTLLSMNVRHNFEAGPVSLLVLGAFAMTLSPAYRLAVGIEPKRTIAYSEIRHRLYGRYVRWYARTVSI